MDFHSYVNHLAESDAPILGYLCWYNVPGSADMDYNYFNSLVSKYGAPIRKMKAPKLGDLFRRACNEAKRSKLATDNPDVFLNVFLRDAGHDDGFIFRSIVLEQVDAEDHRLDYQVIGKAIFSKSSGNITYTDLVGEVADAARDRIQQYFDNRKTLIPAIQVREAARKVLESDLMGVRARPAGGIYFVSLEKKVEVQAMFSLYAELDGCSFHVLPLVDDEAQRGMVREAFESESVGETTELVGEMIELAQSNEPIGVRKFNAIKNRFEAQYEKHMLYKQILEGSLETSEATLSVAKQQLMALIDTTV